MSKNFFNKVPSAKRSLLLIAALLVSFMVGSANAGGYYGYYKSHTIADVVESTNGLDTLAFALSATGLDAVLDSKHKRFTVFAPTNEAFQALADALTGGDVGALANALVGADLLDDVLLYHVAEGRQSLRSILKRGLIPTVIGEKLISGVGNGGANVLGINNKTPSNIVVEGIQTRNGVIYVIDQVLVNIDPAGL